MFVRFVTRANTNVEIKIKYNVAAFWRGDNSENRKKKQQKTFSNGKMTVAYARITRTDVSIVLL